MALGSIPSPWVAEGVDGISCDLPETCGAKWIVPSPTSSPEATLATVSKFHAPMGRTDAFFGESMGRDAMTGTRIVIALAMHVDSNISCFEGTSTSRKMGTYIPGRA